MNYTLLCIDYALHYHFSELDAIVARIGFCVPDSLSLSMLLPRGYMCCVHVFLLISLRVSMNMYISESTQGIYICVSWLPVLFS